MQVALPVDVAAVLLVHQSVVTGLQVDVGIHIHLLQTYGDGVVLPVLFHIVEIVPFAVFQKADQIALNHVTALRVIATVTVCCCSIAYQRQFTIGIIPPTVGDVNLVAGIYQANEATHGQVAGS